MNFAPPYGPLPLLRSERVLQGGRRYLLWLGAVLLGYALLGRGFAHLGLAPIYIGEVALIAGLLVAWRFGTSSGLFNSLPAGLLVVFVIWSAASTLPHLPHHGVDALRDAALWYYSGFAVIITALLLRDGRHLREILLRYRIFVYCFLGAIGALYLATVYMDDFIPAVPGSPHVDLLQVKTGDVLVHLAGVIAFLVAGFMRQRSVLIALLVVTTAVVVVANRGGMMALAVAALVLVLLKPPHRAGARLSAAFVGLLLVATLGGSLMTLRGDREISVEQFWTNVKSVAGGGDERRLDATRTWRIAWWTKIVDYTVTGPYFWTGRGYGINLATADGFQVHGDERLRSPHNGHLTVLARSGVPGLLLWLGLHAAWLATMVGRWQHARRKRDWAWVSFYAFLIPYWLAMLINASFDVYLEGPMGGIWFWCVWGLGLGAAHIHRQRPETLSDQRAGAHPGSTARPPEETGSGPSSERRFHAPAQHPLP